MLNISKEQYNSIPQEQKGIYKDPANNAPHLKNRRTLSHGNRLLLEGVHFIVEGDYKHLPTLTRETAANGLAYAWSDNCILWCQEVYTITEEYAKENQLCYIDRAKTSVGDFALAGSRWSQWSKTPWIDEKEEEQQPEIIPF